MKKHLHKSLACLLALNFIYFQMDAESIRYTNKTHLTPRSLGVNLALENTAGWHPFLHQKVADKEAFGGKTGSSSFYQVSVNETDIGKYFGLQQKNNMLGAIGTNLAAAGADFDLGLMIHNNAAGGAPTANQAANQASIKFTPNQKAYGVYYTYRHDLCKILKNFYFQAVVPFVHIENTMDAIISGQKGTTLKNFLNGTFQRSIGDPKEPQNAQDFLKKARIDGTDATTGVADVDLMLGYSIPFTPEFHAAFNLGVTIPTGTRVTGEKVFEAICGNGRHVGFGGNLDLCARLWGNCDHHLGLHVTGNYRYLFEAQEQRTLGLTGRDFGQYTLLLKKSTANPVADLKTVQLIPAANVLTQNVNVLPGSQFDVIAAFGYCCGGLSVDVGYNFYYREAESVSRRDKFDATQYGIAYQGLDMSAATPIDITLTTPGLTQQTTKVLSDSDIDTGAATTPAQSSHKIYGGLAYIFKDWQMPMLIGFGGHYEFASYNNTLETWGINGKLGFSF